MLRRLGKNRKVGIFVRVVIDGNRKQWSAEMEGNSSLKGVPGGTFWLKWLEHGKSKYRCVGSDPAFAAKARLQQESVLARQAGAETLSTGTRRTLKAAVESYLANVKSHKQPATYAAYNNTLKQFLNVTNKLYFDEVGRQDVLNLITWLRQQNRYKDRTIYNYCENVVAFLKVGPSGEELASPLRRGDWPKFEERVPLGYSIGEVKALRGVARDDEHDVLMIFLDTSFRKSEISNMLWKNVDFANRRVVVQKEQALQRKVSEQKAFQTKDYEQKVIGMTDRLHDRLAARRLRRPIDKYVFPNSKGGPNNHIDRIVHRLAKRARVNMGDKQVLHAWRKTWATRMLQNGMSVAHLLLSLVGNSLSKVLEVPFMQSGRAYGFNPYDRRA
jgi:integrase